ncbi:MAG: protoheme IX farnesyltransferase [Candidatus Kapabacteria bacterium]|nr:protoheme IX farnesyltransferase [Ignavibacteriota bacterium]MCW5885313.1 protoheme IX farnesyltransferase [Candidatus Kapabacteria bacterium]
MQRKLMPNKLSHTANISLMDSLKSYFSIISELSKVRITFFVAISGLVGYILAGNGLDWNIVPILAGIFILSCGSAALNHYQEIDTDSMMVRTKNRPLPTRKITSAFALITVIAMSLSGLALIWYFSNFTAFLLGIGALISYNAIYTPLKRVSAFAIMPGAIVGAMPPAIGWAAAGGMITDPKLFALGMFFFVWQIPHFWFLLLMYDVDYRRAGFPTLSKYFNSTQLKRITYVWVVALAASCMLIPLFGLTHNLLTNLLLLFAGFVLIWRTKPLVVEFDERFNFKLAFLDINLYVLVVVTLLSIDQFVY